MSHVSIQSGAEGRECKKARARRDYPVVKTSDRRRTGIDSSGDAIYINYIIYQYVRKIGKEVSYVNKM